MPAIVAQTIDLSQWTAGEDGKVRGKDKPGNLGGGPQIVFGDFETAIYQIYPSAGSVATRDLWNQYPTGTLGGIHVDNATLDFDTSDFFEGSRSLRVTMDSGSSGDSYPQVPYLQFYTHNNSRWHFLREIVDDFLTIGPWQTGVFNRMSFYVKTPASLNQVTTGQQNMSIGTYFAETGQLQSSYAGNHGYHRFNMPGGMWVKVQMDQHPDHIVGANGNTDHLDWTNPSAAWVQGDEGNTMFDSLSRFYVDIEATQVSAAGTVWNFDAFTVFQQENTENEDSVYGMCVGARASDNTINLTWRRNKNANDTDHEVFYTFLGDPHNIGIENCISLGTVSPLGYQGYNGMTYQTTGINWAGQSRIYFAVRPVGEALFKTISYDLAMAG